LNPHALYSQQKAAWLRANPGATPEQIEAACRAIAERVGI
jgi:hypothetical protein